MMTDCLGNWLALGSVGFLAVFFAVGLTNICFGFQGGHGKAIPGSEVSAKVFKLTAKALSHKLKLQYLVPKTVAILLLPFSVLGFLNMINKHLNSLCQEIKKNSAKLQETVLKQYNVTIQKRLTNPKNLKQTTP